MCVVHVLKKRFRAKVAEFLCRESVSSKHTSRISRIKRAVDELWSVLAAAAYDQRSMNVCWKNCGDSSVDPSIFDYYL